MLKELTNPSAMKYWYNVDTDNSKILSLLQNTDTHVAVKQILIINITISIYSQTFGDHLYSVTSFPNYQKFASHITIFRTSSKRLPLVCNCDHFYS